MSSDRLTFATIRELAAMLRSGETTPTALVEHFIARLESAGRALNAVVTIDRDGALQQARQAAEELARGIDRGPLHGIPYGAKDLVATVGLPTTWGAAPLREQTFDFDATVIKRLREAGAILIAKLAMVELAGGFYNQPNAAFTGPGINPWNTDAWSGGSSSGSGSAVGAGCVPFAIGSETLGSIVTPASYCGVSGVRPSYGRVSKHGAMALSWTLDKLGPLGRTADDCGLVLDAIAGPDPADPSTIATPYRYQTERTTGFRLGVLRDGLDAAQPEVRANFEASLDVLKEIATLEDVTLPDLPYQEVGRIVIASEAAAAMEHLLEEDKIGELTAPEDRIGIYAGLRITAVDYLRAMRVRREICAAAEQVFGPFDGIVTPTTLQVASPLDVPFDVYRGKARWTATGAIGNLAGLPAVSVPNGFGERGLPTAIQVVSRFGGENAMFAVARAYQERTDWHTRYPDW